MRAHTGPFSPDTPSVPGRGIQGFSGLFPSALLLTVLCGCHPAVGNTPALAPAAVGASWQDAGRPLRLHGQALVKTPFAKIPMMAFVAVDRSRDQLDFVGMGEWGGKLAEVSLDGWTERLDVVPMLKRFPGLRAHLPEALHRIFLEWPDVGRVPSPRLDREPGTGCPLLKRGGEDDTRWRVEYACTPGSDGTAIPTRIEYRCGGFSLILMLTEAFSDE